MQSWEAEVTGPCHPGMRPGLSSWLPPLALGHLQSESVDTGSLFLCLSKKFLKILLNHRILELKASLEIHGPVLSDLYNWRESGPGKGRELTESGRHQMAAWAGRLSPVYFVPTTLLAARVSGAQQDPRK